MEIANTIVYLKNRSPRSAIPNCTPYELWHSRKPDLMHLKIIGSTAYVHISKEKRIKLDVHSHKGIMIRYGGTNQYRIWDLTKKDIVVSQDVVFIEGKLIEQTPAAYIEETRHDPITVTPIYDSITVLPGPPGPQRQLATPALTEPDYLASDSDDELEPVDPQILLQEPSAATQKTFAQSNKGTFTLTKFADEDFDKGKRAHVAKMARNTDPNDEE